jgi:hypothetical protein
MRAYLIGSLRRLESERGRYFDSQSSFPVERVDEPRLILKFRRWSCKGTNVGSRAWNLVPLSAFAFQQWLVAHYRHDTDRSKSGKIKGACTGLGQINAAALT